MRLFTLTFLLFFTSLAQAQNPSLGTSPQAILSMVQLYGTAELDVDDIGPYITGEVDDLFYTIDFYGCDGTTGCDRLRFYASWIDAGVTPQQANDHNNTTILGRVMIEDDGDLVVDYAINLASEISIENLDDSFQWFRGIMTDVVDDLL